jgi:hypothetical protein
VSRVLNDHPNVREQTRLRVRAAIAELGYRPNRAARTLVTGRSQVLGAVALSSTLYGPASMLSAFEQAAAGAGFAVSVASVRTLDRRSIADAVDRHLDQRVAGIVIIAPVVSANEALDDLPAGVPLVAIDGDPQRSTALVTVDQVAGARAATDVTGFGLLGHLHKMCRASGVGAVLDRSAVPLVEGAAEALRDGYVSGGTRRNLDWVRPHLQAAPGVGEDDLLLLADAQTSGGLLVVGEVPGYPVVGHTVAGSGITVR